MTAFTMIRSLKRRLGLAKDYRVRRCQAQRVGDQQAACECLEDRTLLDAAAATALGADRLDTAFGTNGSTTTNFNAPGIFAEPTSAFASAVVVQPNGKILVAGTVHQDGNQNFAVARYQSNGALDRSFGTAGRVVISFDLGGNLGDVVSGMALQSNGRIVIVGTADVDDDGDRNFAIVRLRSNGTLDTSFDVDGKQTVAFDRGGNLQDTAGGVVVQSDDKIVVAGTATMDDSGDTDFAIARLLSTGVLDGSFDTDGQQTVDIREDSGLADIATAVAIGRGGKIIVAGSSEASSGGGHDFAVVRLNTNGSLDTKFSGDGRATVAFDLGGNNDDRATSLGIQSNGRIVVGGYSQIDDQGNDDFAVARLNSDGSRDRSFDLDGRATVSFDVGGTNQDRMAALAIQANGQIVLVGHAEMSAAGDFDFAVVRLDRNGSLDTNFDGDGKATIAFDRGGSNADFATGIAIQSNRRIVIAGRAETGTEGDFEFALTRLFGLG